MNQTLTQIEEEEFDKVFPHSQECLKANSELKEKFKMEFGEKCMCIERNKFKALLTQSNLRVIEKVGDSIKDLSCTVDNHSEYEKGYQSAMKDVKRVLSTLIEQK